MTFPLRRIAPFAASLVALLLMASKCPTDLVETPDPGYVASFSYATSGTVVQFQDESSPEPADWEWDFAGLGRSTQSNPAFDFGAEGAFPVTLTVTFADGAKRVRTRTVTTTDAGSPTTSHTLDVSVVGSGTVTSTPAGIDCGGACVADFAEGTNVGLSAAAGAGFAFQGWQGDADCSDGVVAMSGPRSCEAVFALAGSITLSPSSVTLTPGASQAFTASAADVTDPSVTWSASCGSFSSTGNPATYVAPSSATTCAVTVTSVEVPSESATATVTVRAVAVGIDPTRVSLYEGESVQFTANVSGSSDTSVTWSATCGTISGSGATVTYLAPAFAAACEVTATSVADAGASATADVDALGPVPAVLGVSIDQGDVDLRVGEAMTFSVAVTTTGGASSEVTWSSSDVSVVAIDPDSGEATAVDEGRAIITAISAFDASRDDTVSASSTFGAFGGGTLVAEPAFSAPDVAVDGDWMLIVDDDDGSRVVEAYERSSGGSWTYAATLRPPSGSAPYVAFGNHLALSGSTAAVGATRQLSSGSPASESVVVIFERGLGGTWSPGPTLMSGEGVSLTYSDTVALANGTLAVGIPGEEDGESELRIYHRDYGGSGAWGLADELPVPSGVSDRARGYFGTGVDLSSDGRLLAVAMSYQGRDECLGDQTFIYERASADATVWLLIDEIPTDEWSSCSSRVQIDGDILALRERPTNLPGQSTIPFSLFQRGVGGPDEWGLVRSERFSILYEGDFWGLDRVMASHRVRGDTVLFGTTTLECSESDGSFAACPSGDVYVLRRNEGGSDAWGVAQTLRAPLSYGNQGFGANLDIADDGRTVVVDTRYEVFVFER